MKSSIADESLSRLSDEINSSRRSAGTPRDSIVKKPKKGFKTSLDIANEIEMQDDEIGKATWGEVFHACCVHTPQEWFRILVGLVLFVACLYFFGVGLELLGTGAKIFTSCFAGTLFGDSVNPVAGVMIGVIVTVLLQSSSTTTSIIVGLVGAEGSLFTVQQGIYMIMGANIGTTVTSTIVSLAHFQNPDQLELAFSGATMHDLFNFFTVLILLPVEVLTGYLDRLTVALVRGADTESGEKWEGPAKRYIKPLIEKIAIANKDVTNSVAGGGSCDDFYPIYCTDPENPTKATCKEVGLIACSKATGKCPVFFDAEATQLEDQFSGIVVFTMGFVVICLALSSLVHVLTQLLTGVSIRVIYKATNMNGYILIGIGCGLTMFFQSSSTTTSFLTPIVGMGALRLEQMYPLTIGANLGTTITALLSALVTDGNDALQVALAHLMFNVTGMMIWYPIPFMRNIPITCARRLGQYARVWRSFTLVYLFGAYLIAPGLLLGLSAMVNSSETGLEVGGWIVVGFIVIFLGFFLNWCYRKNGRITFYNMLVRKRQTYDAKLTLPTDMDRAIQQVRQHQDYAGLQVLRVDGSDETGVGSEYNSDSKAVKHAVRRLARDMHFVKTAISMLYYHTGLPEEHDFVEIEDEEADSSTAKGEGSSEEQVTEKSQSERARQRSKAPETTFVQFMFELPLSWKLLSVLVFALGVVGLVVLYGIDSSAARGAAVFVSVLVGLLFLYLVHLWVGPEGRKGLLEYVRNFRERDTYIHRLPRDMLRVKVGVKELLAHYNLTVSEEKLGWNDNSSEADTSSVLEYSSITSH